MRKLLYFSLALVVTMQAKAQKDSLFYYKSAISVTPLMIVPPDATLMGGYEYRLAPKMTAVLDAGLVFASTYYFNNGKALGYHLRPMLRFYTNRRNNFYLGPQFMFKSVTHYLTDWVTHSGGAYTEYRSFRYRRFVGGVNVVTGVTLPAFHNSMFFDLYAGLGFRWKTSRVAGHEDFTYRPETAFGLDTETEGEVLPSLPLGFRLIFPLR